MLLHNAQYRVGRMTVNMPLKKKVNIIVYSSRGYQTTIAGLLILFLFESGCTVRTTKYNMNRKKSYHQYQNTTTTEKVIYHEIHIFIPILQTFTKEVSIKLLSSSLPILQLPVFENFAVFDHINLFPRLARRIKP
jgi:hypothetical protein